MVDFPTILRGLHDRRSDAVLSVANHFLPPSGSREEEATRISDVANLRQKIGDI